MPRDSDTKKEGNIFPPILGNISQKSAARLLNSDCKKLTRAAFGKIVGRFNGIILILDRPTATIKLTEVRILCFGTQPTFRIWRVPPKSLFNTPSKTYCKTCSVKCLIYIKAPAVAHADQCHGILIAHAFSGNY